MYSTEMITQTTFPAQEVRNLLEGLLTHEVGKALLFDFFETRVLPERLQTKGLYHVYIRERDVDPYHVDNDLHLYKTFASEPSAVDWIINHGKEAISDSRTVLVLIYRAADDDTNTCCVKCPMFAFSKREYESLLEEHEGDIWTGADLNPYWINYIHHGKITRGLSRKQFKLLQKKCIGRRNHKVKLIQEEKEYNDMKEDADAFIQRKRIEDGFFDYVHW
jgi:hypothetical protein